MKIFLVLISFFGTLHGKDCNQTIPENFSLESYPLALSAYNRAKTNVCKTKIRDLLYKSLKHEEALKNDYQIDVLYKSRLKRKCSSANIDNSNLNSNIEVRISSRFFVSCVFKEDLLEFLGNFDNRHLFKKYKHDFNVSVIKNNVSDLQLCIDVCLGGNKFAAFNYRSKNCICLALIDPELKAEFYSKDECIGLNKKFGDSKIYEIYNTGFLEFTDNQLNVPIENFSQKLKRFNRLKSSDKLVRIVFMIVLNGRSIRQVKRLIKTIYDDHHYYYFHVDDRMVFLKDEIKKIITKSNRSNLHLANWSMTPIWGGSSFLQLFLKVLEDIVMFKNEGRWNWDFVINLSETDFPIKTVQEFTLFLNDLKTKNFILFSNPKINNMHENKHFRYLFLECENHLWKINKRTIPFGIQFGEGNNWFILNSKFVDYLVNSSSNEFLTNLKKFYMHTFVALESYIHTALLNSEFCDDYMNHNLRYNNWNKCECEEEKLSISDYCGCSPDIITLDHAKFFDEVLSKYLVFFARKFNPLRSNQIINYIDESVFGKYLSDIKSLNSYWQNIYYNRDMTVANKLKSLIAYFFKISTVKFKEKLDAIVFFEKYIEVINSAKFDLNEIEVLNDFNFILTVDLFSELDTIKGHVISFKVKNNQSKIQYEYQTYFTLSENYHVLYQNTHELAEFKEIDSFLQSLVDIHICSEYTSTYPKKLDYCAAPLIDQQSDPELVVKFNNSFTKSFEIEIIWTDSYGNRIKNHYFDMVNMHQSNILNSTLFARNDKKFINSTGIWTLELRNYGNVLLIKKFLVLPSDPIFESQNLSFKNDWIKNFQMFYKFDSICVKRIQNKHSKQSYSLSRFFKNCDSEAYWSTSYPDPKSDILNEMGLDFKSRKLN